MGSNRIIMGFMIFFILIVVIATIITFTFRPNHLIPPGPEPYVGIAYFAILTIVLCGLSIKGLIKRD